MSALRKQVLAFTAACVALAACTQDTPYAPVFVRPADAVDVDVDFCTFGPSWLAIQEDGDATWYPVTTSILVSRYRLAVTPKVTIAYGYYSLTNSAYSEVNVIYLTATELASMNCGPAPGTLRMTAPVAGVPSNSQASATLGPASAFASNGSASVTLLGVRDELQDLVAIRSQLGGLPEKYIVRHDVTTSPNGAMPLINFDSTEAVAATPVKVVGPGAGFFVPKVKFITSRATLVTLFGALSAGGPDTGYMFLPPASVLASGDRFSVRLPQSGGSVTQYFGTPATQTMPALAALNTPTVTQIGTSPSRFRAQLPSQPAFPSLARAKFGTSSEQTVTVTVTAAYLGGTPTTWQLDVPDFGRLLPSNRLLAGTLMSTSWTVEAWDARAPLFFSSFGASDGEVVRCATKSKDFSLLNCTSPIGLSF